MQKGGADVELANNLGIAHKCALFLFAALVKYVKINWDISLVKQLRLGFKLSWAGFKWALLKHYYH